MVYGWKRAWHSIVRPHASVVELGEVARAQFIAGLVAVGVPGGVIATAIRVWVDPGYWDSALQALAGMVAMSSMYLLARSRWWKWSAWGICLLSACVPTAIAVNSKETWILLGYLACPIVLAGVILSARATVAVAIFTIAIALLAGFREPALHDRVFLSAAPLFLFIVMLLTALNIRVRENVERRRRMQLEQSEAQYRRVFDRTFEGSAWVARGRLIEMNDGLQKLIGARRDELLGRDAADLFTPAHRADLQRLLEHEGAVELQLVDGQRTLDLEVVASHVPYHGEMAVLLAVRDRSARRNAERLMAASERTIALGQVAAGVAHEINNPLSFVVTNLDSLEQCCAAAPPAARTVEIVEALQGVRAGAERIRIIVRDLKALTRPIADVDQVVELVDVIELALRMSAMELKYRAQVLIDMTAKLRVKGNASKLGQVLVNLLVNAARALPEGHVERNRVTVRLTAEGQRARIDVIDTGPGIPPDVLPHIFDPFFSTRARSGGTGLGLSICHSIIRSHDGEIRVATSSTGTTFSIFLPITTDAPAPVVSLERPQTQRGRRLRVLVADDEKILLAALARMLSAHEVTTCLGGKEALNAAQQGTFDVVLCDLMMPQITGMDVVRELVRAGRITERRVVIMTGGAFGAEAESFLEGFRGRTLEKPIRLEDVNAVVDAVVDELGVAQLPVTNSPDSVALATRLATHEPPTPEAPAEVVAATRS